MARLLFEKKGNAIWISHLDLMRLFQRSFKRAGLPLKHSQGFNPRPSVSIALPLSVGVESQCELLDFTLEGEYDPKVVLRRLNEALVSGVVVRDVYENGGKLRDLALLACRVTLEYDAGVPQGASEEIQSLFSRDCLVVEKKGKSGLVEQDIRPMIHSAEVLQAGEKCVRIEAVIRCQNPTLNPALLAAAIGKYLPQYRPDFTKICREEIYDDTMTIFR
ncbi:MAG TPA: DUF2344 domain-containing protein [Candidatus Faecousia intestinigallinarum]|nr:DUF2344 domain-containing protein [Candidatus Faecousia intestinigallinarum]